MLHAPPSRVKGIARAPRAPSSNQGSRAGFARPLLVPRETRALRPGAACLRWWALPVWGATDAGTDTQCAWCGLGLDVKKARGIRGAARAARRMPARVAAQRRDSGTARDPGREERRQIRQVAAAAGARRVRQLRGALLACFRRFTYALKTVFAPGRYAINGGRWPAKGGLRVSFERLAMSFASSRARPADSVGGIGRLSRRPLSRCSERLPAR